MDKLTPYEIKIIKILSKLPDGLSEDEAESKFGKEVTEILYDLYKRDIVEIKYRQEDMANNIFIPCGNWIISNYGKSCLIQQKSIHSKSVRQKWGDRIWGFITGLISGIIVGFVLGYFSF